MKRLISLFLCSVLVTACSSGGGGGNGALPAAPVVSVSADEKVLEFAWETVSDAFYYQLLANLDGVSGFSIVEDHITWDSVRHEIAVHKMDWLNGRFQVAACNDAGCTSSAAIAVTDLMLDTIGSIRFPDQPDAAFGVAVALSGDGRTLAVGAPYESSAATGVNGESNDTATESGAVYVYYWLNQQWNLQAYIKASNTELFDRFGWSLSLSQYGNVLAVGAPYEDSAAINGDDMPDPADQLDNTAIDSGAVYVFSRQGTDWSQQAYVKSSNTNGLSGGELFGDMFGIAVSLSDDGEVLAVGADLEDGDGSGPTDNSTKNSGAVYTYEFVSNKWWFHRNYIKASNAGTEDSFGRSLDLNADASRLVVGAPGEYSAATGINPAQSDDSAKDAGAVYVFDLETDSWSQTDYIKASNAEGGNMPEDIQWEGDRFGHALALSADGNILAVGAFNEASASRGIEQDQTSNTAPGSGAVYVFADTAGQWAQEAYIKASNADGGNQTQEPEEGDAFGFSIALSADGNTLAVGAPDEDSTAIGIGGDESDNSLDSSGAVYTFRRGQGVWQQQAYIKPGFELLDFAFFGVVALSDDANTLVVGKLDDFAGYVFTY